MITYKKDDIVVEYNDCLYNHYWLKRFSNSLKRFIKNNNIQMDVLTGVGVSGTILLPILGLKLNIPYAVIRKKNTSHSDYIVEGYIDNLKNYYILDDFVSSGKTLQYNLKSLLDIKIQPKGLILYNNSFIVNKLNLIEDIIRPFNIKTFSVIYVNSPSVYTLVNPKLGYKQTSVYKLYMKELVL